MEKNFQHSLQTFRFLERRTQVSIAAQRRNIQLTQFNYGNISIVSDSICTFDKGDYDLAWFWFKLISEVGLSLSQESKITLKLSSSDRQHREANESLGVVHDEILRYTECQTLENILIS